MVKMEKYGRLQINLLGNPEVWLDGQRLTSFSTAKTEALLYFLAATRQVHSRETLAGLLWGEMQEGKARRNLTKSLSVLRRLLEPFLMIEAQRVGFDPAVPIDLDVTRLEAAVSSPTSPSKILNLYRGDFLEGFHVKDAIAFEEWQLAQREQLRETAINLLKTGIEQAIQDRDYPAGIPLARRLLQLDPWRESAHRQLMLLLARQGQLAAALTQYEQCRQVLAEELGVEPVGATTALFQRLRSARNKTAYSLPYEAAPLVGREQELARILALLQEPECRLLTITGLGGMGKTRLALAAAHRVNQESSLLFINGVAFVSLTGVADATAVPLALANAMDVPLTSAATPRRALKNFLLNREMLLVIDNMEHLTEASELLLDLLQSCPDIKLLVTSRRTLNLSSEWRFDLEGLPIPEKGERDPDILSRYAAVILFTRSAAQVNSQVRLAEENAGQIGQLCRLVAGMPLALQLAATWLRTMPIAAVLAELKSDLDILATDMQDIPARQRSMRTIFESTWMILADDERHAVETLSICRGGFTQEAAASIAKINPFLLRRLINHGLIYQRDESRYDMHALTRQFAREQLAANKGLETAVARHGRYYLAWLIEQTPDLHGQTPEITIKAIENELDNVRQAWGWATQTNQHDLSLDSLKTLAIFYDLLGLLQEGEALAESALSYLEETTNSQQEMLLCWALITKCKFVVAQGQYERGAKIVERVLVLARRLGDEEAVADIRHQQGSILIATGNYPDAKYRFKQALAIHRRIGEDWKTIETLIELGWVHFLDGENEAALPNVEEALTLGRKAGDKRSETNALGVLATVTSTSGDPQKAIQIQKKVITAYKELGDLLNLERSENNIGMTHLGVGQYKDSLPHIQRAVELARQIGARPELINALDTLATAYIACGNYKKAKVCLDEALEAALEIGYMYMNYSVRAILVRLFNHTGELALAEDQLQQLLPMVERLENAQYVARSLAEKAHLTFAQGDLSKAADLAARAIDIFRQNPSPLDMPFVLLQYAGYLSELEQFEDALPLVEEAIAMARQLDHKPLQLRSQALAANLSITLGQAETAFTYEQNAASLLAEMDPYPDVLTGLLDLGRYQFQSGDSQQAQRLSAFIAAHPAAPHTVRSRAEALLKETSPPSPTKIPPIEPANWTDLF